MSRSNNSNSSGGNGSSSGHQQQQQQQQHPDPRFAVEGSMMSSLSDLMETEFSFSSTGGSNVAHNRLSGGQREEATAAAAAAAAAAAGGGLDVGAAAANSSTNDDSVFGRPSSPSAMSARSMDSADSCHSMEAEKKGRLEVSVRPARYQRSNSNVSNSAATSAGGGQTQMQIYRMDSRPRGMALIVEIEEYDNDVQERRVGSQVCLPTF